MCSGKTHDKITYILALGSVPISYVVGFNGFLVGGTCLFSGLMFGPDLDIDSIEYRRWGCLKFIWKPYKDNIPHRSYLSHGAFIGTIIRVLYLGTVWLLFWGLLSTVLNVPVPMPDLGYSDFYFQGFLGLELGSAGHYLADQYCSGRKRHGNRR